MADCQLYSIFNVFLKLHVYYNYAI